MKVGAFLLVVISVATAPAADTAVAASAPTSATSAPTSATSAPTSATSAPTSAGERARAGARWARVRDLPPPAVEARAAREAPAGPRRWMAERRRLNAWVAALRREVGALERRVRKAATEEERRDIRARMAERRADIVAISLRLAELKRRLIGGKT